MGPLQICAGYSAGAEAAIHAASNVCDEKGTDRILLTDATNALNQINSAATMHNLKI